MGPLSTAARIADMALSGLTRTVKTAGARNLSALYQHHTYVVSRIEAALSGIDQAKHPEEHARLVATGALSARRADRAAHALNRIADSLPAPREDITS